MLDEIRQRAVEKKEVVQNDPNEKPENVEYADFLTRFFDNTDAIAQAPRSLVHGALYYLGYEYEKLNDVHKALLDEINTVYAYVSPETIEQAKRNFK